MEKRLLKLKTFLKGITTRAECKQLVNLDQQKAEHAGVGKKDFVTYSNNFRFNLLLNSTLIQLDSLNCLCNMLNPMLIHHSNTP